MAFLDYTVWIFYSMPVLFLAIYIIRKVRHQRKSVKYLHESRAARLTEPASLHPVFDIRKCIGCGACAAACPEGTVIGLINRKPHLVNPTECIGHGACQAACPVDGITLVFGSKTRGVDIPLVDPEFQTNIPGIYIAGELGGMGLIKNAISQGRQAIESIAKAKRKAAKDEFDVVIIGAGPAGFAATLGAIKAGMRYVTLEQDSFGGTVAHFPRGKIVMTAPAQLPLEGKIRFSEVGKEELIKNWDRIAKKHKVVINTMERMEKISQLDDDGFAVQTAKGIYHTRAILMAIGRRGTPRKLGVPGEETSKVVYRLVDPAQYAGQHVLIVGGGDSALEAACSIAEQPGTKVTLSYRSDAFARAKPKNRIRVEDESAAGRLSVLFKSNVKNITADKVELEQEGNLLSIPNDAVIVNAGGILPTPLLKELGITINTKYGTE